MSKLVPPHGKERKLKPLLLEGEARKAEMEKAKTLKKVPMTSWEALDLVMLGIGAFTPLDGFMGYDDWKGVCDAYKMPTAPSGPFPSPFLRTRIWPPVWGPTRKWPCGMWKTTRFLPR